MLLRVVDVVPVGTPKEARNERGATLVEYAIILALLVMVSLVAIEQLGNDAGVYLQETGDGIGEPRENVENLDHDLPDPPDWTNN